MAKIKVVLGIAPDSYIDIEAENAREFKSALGEAEEIIEALKPIFQAMFHPVEKPEQDVEG